MGPDETVVPNPDLYEHVQRLRDGERDVCDEQFCLNLSIAFAATIVAHDQGLQGGAS
jgi:hypothetical protein